MSTTEEELQNMSPEQFAEYQKQNCIFCKIIAGEIPSKKVYEDNEFYAILDINPAAEGHTLLMPKKHIQIMPQMDQALVGKIGDVSKKISSKLLKAFSVEGTSIFIANGVVAGQKAPHFIIHIIPRKENDGLALNPELKELDSNKFEQTRKVLQEAMGIKSENKEEQPKEKVKTPKNEVPKKEDESKKEDASESKSKKSKMTKEDLDKISKLFT